MKKIAFATLILFVAAACNKKDVKPSEKKGDHYVYYSEDYRNADVTILGENASDIEAVWFELYYENDHCKQESPDRYALIVKNADGELIKELGNVESDWSSYINFSPDNGTAYAGEMTFDKETISVKYEYPNRTEKVTFIYKDYK